MQLPWEGRLVTKYEAAARREGRPCYYFAYRRSTSPAPDVPVIKEAAMPHVVFISPLTLNAMAERFEPIKYSEGGTSIHLMGAFVGKEALLIEAHVGEPTITQHVALLIAPHLHRETQASGMSEYTIQLGTIGQPRATAGMHQAVRLLKGWVLSLHPDSRIIKEKLGDSD